MRTGIEGYAETDIQSGNSNLNIIWMNFRL
jgi:hypothetical protein